MVKPTKNYDTHLKNRKCSFVYIKPLPIIDDDSINSTMVSSSQTKLDKDNKKNQKNAKQISKDKSTS